MTLNGRVDFITLKGRIETTGENAQSLKIRKKPNPIILMQIVEPPEKIVIKPVLPKVDSPNFAPLGVPIGIHRLDAIKFFSDNIFSTVSQVVKTEVKTVKVKPGEKPFDIHEAEAWHDPSKGHASGLDAKEMAEIKKQYPELAKEYERMAKSKINQDNLAADKKKNAEMVERSQKEYEIATKEYANAQKALQGNWFTNFFRSNETIERQKRDVAFAKLRLNRAQAMLRYAKGTQKLENENVISYTTLLMRNGGKEIK